jgi:RNA polymerase sigma-70 factor (ECF subfamily)
VKSVDAEQWIEAARRGNLASVEQLYRPYVVRLYGLCVRMRGNHSDAEDSVQNAFISAWRKLDQFKGQSDFGTWLHRIAVNEVLMVQRRRPFEAVTDWDAHLPAQMPQLDAQIDLETAIAELPDQARNVFVLRALYGYSHDEIAQFTGIAAGTARAHYHRARELLQRRLKLEDDDD